MTVPNEVNILAALDRVSTPPEEIAARISAFVREMNARVPLAWEELRSRKPWEGTDEQLAAIVRRNASTAARRVPDPTDGYRLVMSADTENQVLVSGIGVGSPYFGRRLPTQNVDGEVRARGGYGSVDPVLADAMFESIITAWEPLMCRMSTLGIIDAQEAQLGHGRGNWHIVPGYRVWLRDDAVTVNEVAEGVERRSFAGGTLLSVPFEWPAEDVVRAMLTTLEMNGLDEMPHPVP